MRKVVVKVERTSFFEIELQTEESEEQIVERLILPGAARALCEGHEERDVDHFAFEIDIEDAGVLS
jgi:hypothetical protein